MCILNANQFYILQCLACFCLIKDFACRLSIGKPLNSIPKAVSLLPKYKGHSKWYCNMYSPAINRGFRVHVTL